VPHIPRLAMVDHGTREAVDQIRLPPRRLSAARRRRKMAALLSAIVSTPNRRIQ
jgi:hypothetical protein